MGEPISKIARQALENLCLNGISPTPEQLHVLGIDVKLLEQAYDTIMEKLPQLEGYVTLEQACRGEYTRETTKTWEIMVAEAGLTGIRVLRLVEEDGHERLWPILHGVSAEDLEVFLTRNGDWIIWDGGESLKTERPWSFVKRRTIRSMIKTIGPLQKPAHWARPDAKSYPALLLRSGIKEIVDKSVITKQERVKPIAMLSTQLLDVDKRNGLST